MENDLLQLLNNIWLVYLDTAFWMLLGLLAAGLIKSFISEATMKRWVGGRGLASIVRAALFGAPLPLCSCGVLPAAIGLRRAGASKEATVAFLISTPETSLDSIAVTYALMGPIMAVFRPFAALFNAIGTGLLTTLVPDHALPVATAGESAAACCGASKNNAEDKDGPCDSNTAQEPLACCAATPLPDNESEPANSASEPACCGSEQPRPDSRLFRALAFAGAELLDDLSKWLAIGIVLAGIMLTFIPPGWLAQWGGGLGAMLVMLVVGIPMYICAVASTPVAAGLLLAGVSPGAVLIFLLVGPATNIASFVVLKQQLGLKVTLVYLAGLAVLSLVMGLLLEWLLALQGWRIQASLGEAHAMLPAIVTWSSAVLLLVLAVRPLRRRLLPWLG